MKYIELTRGQKCIVDDADFARLSKYRWNAKWSPSRKQFTAVRSQWVSRKNRMISMHREIMEAPLGLDVDHKNRNPLDNRRINLRIATRTQNNANAGLRKDNKSGYKGVYWFARQRSWGVNIYHKGHKTFLGYFKDAKSASNAYDVAAKKLFGEFALTNDTIINALKEAL